MAVVTDCRLLAVDLPFRAAFRHAAATRDRSESLFLRVRLDDGTEGWGESLPRHYVSGETREAAFDLLRGRILPQLVGRTFASLAEVVAFLEACDGKAPAGWVGKDVPNSSAWCCVDLALLDVFGRATGAATTIGPPRVSGDIRPPELPRFSGVLSAGAGLRHVLALLKMRAFGFRQVKLKLGREGALAAAALARRALGSSVDLRVDANMAWDVEQTLALARSLRRYGIEWFEQPIAAGDLTGLARLVRESACQIVADEGFTDGETLKALIANRACTGVNVRISKCGGLVAAYARCRQALQAGLGLQIGCQVGESSLLSAAQLSLLSALATSAPGVRYVEGCFGRHLLHEDPASPVVQFGRGGRAPRRSTAAGLGVTIDPSVIARWTVAEVRVSTNPKGGTP